MAFSMFLRSKACTSAFRQQLQCLSSQPAIIQRTISQLPACSVSIKSVQPVKTTTPILNAVRSISTTPVRMAEHAHDHAKLWVVEKLASALLVPLIPLALAMPCKALDCACAILITAHSFWGLEACVMDYIRVLLFGDIIPKMAMAIVWAITVTMLGGLFWHIFSGYGLAGSFWKLWMNMENPNPPQEGPPSPPCPPKQGALKPPAAAPPVKETKPDPCAKKDERKEKAEKGASKQ